MKLLKGAASPWPRGRCGASPGATEHRPRFGKVGKVVGAGEEEQAGREPPQQARPGGPAGRMSPSGQARPRLPAAGGARHDRGRRCRGRPEAPAGSQRQASGRAEQVSERAGWGEPTPLFIDISFPPLNPSLGPVPIEDTSRDIQNPLILPKDFPSSIPSWMAPLQLPDLNQWTLFLLLPVVLLQHRMPLLSHLILIPS